jgi:hypothetical protein
VIVLDADADAVAVSAEALLAHARDASADSASCRLIVVRVTDTVI